MVCVMVDCLVRLPRVLATNFATPTRYHVLVDFMRLGRLVGAWLSEVTLGTWDLAETWFSQRMGHVCDRLFPSRGRLHHVGP